MSEQYTPNISDFREDFVLAATQSMWMKETEARLYFDSELSAIETAAEQRGAARGKVEGLREAADEAGSWGSACINAALAIRRSADLLEGDE